ncbi:hypothetical protein [Mumia zhuanghuii]|uniref:hypothetical protein n=1 Tax=Mumia zhuanghuii TaxID=2585211 RepID=UPI0036300534
MRTEGSATRGTVATIAGFLVAGAVAGVAWALLADPLQYTVVRVDDRSGLSADEVAASAAFGVLLTYAWVSAVAAAVWSAFATWRWGREGGVGVVARTAIGAAVAALVAWGVGVLLGPPTPEVGSRPAGAEVPARLGIDAYGILFVWPVAALLALLLISWLMLLREPVEEIHVAEPV